MKYRLKGTQDVDAIVFQDGQEPNSEYGINILKLNDGFLSAYVLTNGQKIDVTDGDYVVKYSDGSLEVLSEAEFIAKFEPSP